MKKVVAAASDQRNTATAGGWLRYKCYMCTTLNVTKFSTGAKICHAGISHTAFDNPLELHGCLPAWIYFVHLMLSSIDAHLIFKAGTEHKIGFLHRMAMYRRCDDPYHVVNSRSSPSVLAYCKQPHIIYIVLHYGRSHDSHTLHQNQCACTINPDTCTTLLVRYACKCMY